MAEKKVLIKAVNLKQYFPVGKNRFCKANDGISVDIYEGETFGLVGESGCGKSTFGRTLIQLNKQTSGKALYYGQTLEEIAPRYVSKTLSGYRKLLADYHKFERKVQAAQSAYDAMPENTPDRFTKLNELNMLKADLEGKYYDIANVLGGFLTLEDPSAQVQLLKEEYDICRKSRGMLEKIQTADAKLRDVEYTMEQARKSGKSTARIEGTRKAAQAKVDRLQEQKKKLEAQLAQKRQAIQAAREQYANDPAFQEAESYRDDGIDLSRLKYNEMRLLRSDVQMIFQDPYSSLNPRMTVGNIIGNGMKTHHLFIKENGRMQEEVLKVMEQCGLQSYFLHRFPHQFSGGQRQRIGIARSLALRPKFVICDEAVSALDVSIQSQIINLLQHLKKQSNLTYLFITHDLSVVKYISDRIGVMYLGNMVELAPSQEIFSNPMHPYTQALIRAIPTVESRDKELHILEGDIPSPVNPPQGCKFHTRCDHCTEICKHVVPAWEEVSPGHFAACHHMHELEAARAPRA
ncbi:MAG: ATP-binding cassette domain-containing protein [Clostridia bacterium]|nr:ATP-binding cassette domain-containing protein [Clostridia bacterium]